MGWSIKNTNNKWDVYSSVTDSCIASLNSQKECAKFIALEKVYDGKKKAIEELMRFPNGWYVNGSRRLNDTDSIDQYYNWIISISDCNTYEEYYERIDKKLNELLE